MARMTRFAAAVAVVIIAGLAGCAPSPPLELDNQGTTYCLSAAGTRDAMLGTILANRSSSEVTLDRLEITSVNLDLQGAWLVPTSPPEAGVHGYGLETWPLDDDVHPDWRTRIDAEGATLAPDTEYSLVLRLSLAKGTEKAELQGFTVVTTQLGAPFDLTASTSTDVVVELTAGDLDDCGGGITEE